MSSSVSSYLNLAKRVTQGLDNTSIPGEAEYSINFTENEKKFCFSLHYNRSNSYLFVNGVEIY